MKLGMTQAHKKIKKGREGKWLNKMKKCLSGEIKNKSIKKYVEKYAYF